MVSRLLRLRSCLNRFPIGEEDGVGGGGTGDPLDLLRVIAESNLGE